MALVGAILIIVAYYLIDFFTEFLFIFAIGDKIEYEIDIAFAFEDFGF